MQIVHILRTVIKGECMENGSCVNKGLFQNKPSLELLLKLDEQKYSCSGKTPPLNGVVAHFGIPIL